VPKTAAMNLTIFRTVTDLRAATNPWRQQGHKIAVVPTMGALHAGHLSLVQAARAQADRVIVTLFVNPKQFNNADDLAAYPRTEASDVAQLAPLGVDILYAPTETEMYPPGFASSICVSGISEGLCGAHRPGHFNGVATIVAKLFLQTGADMAFFGEKDFQQVAVVRRMVMDLNIPIDVRTVPIVREADGLAMSSRNIRLSAAERAIAPTLAATLIKTAAHIASGTPIAPVLATAKTALLAAGFREIDYLECRSDTDLQPLKQYDRPARLLVAAWLGNTRLIDTVAIQ
jgi:pantoate--beta-alanine ligase